jgi:hypothetical protein
MVESDRIYLSAGAYVVMLGEIKYRTADVPFMQLLFPTEPLDVTKK